MYLIELLIKKLTRKKEKPAHYPIDGEDDQNKVKEYETCEHTFMPMDSTSEILSCTKCGILVKRSDLKNKNFFRG